jgi:hypothetical protein
MGKKRRILNNPKFKSKRSRLWGEMNRTEELVVKTEQAIEKLETFKMPEPVRPTVTAVPKSTAVKKTATKRKTTRTVTAKKTSKQ